MKCIDVVKLVTIFPFPHLLSTFSLISGKDKWFNLPGDMQYVYLYVGHVSTSI